MNNERKRKYTKKEGLFVPARQVSMLVAGALMLVAIVFLGGYFVGKKHMMEQFVAQVETDSFADQVYASMCSLYEVHTDDELMLLATNEDSEEQSQWNSSDESKKKEREKIEEEAGAVLTKASSEALVLEGEAPSGSPAYVGQLLSYHVRQYADSFVQRVAKKNISLEVRTRKSVTACGEQKEWYQVVTKPYADRHELEVVVGQLSQEENIKGAHIIVC
jgi:hypothetical protein